jgi:hypothetical protein
VQAFPLRKEDYGYPNKGVPAQPTQLPAPTADTPTAPLAALKAVAAAGEMPPLAQVTPCLLATQRAGEGKKVGKPPPRKQTQGVSKIGY